ncbi:OCIA domain-containing protein 1 [Aethina tumida]|uniref:OCIA domain-containing protein 1 n=1 Tax=Aethina tumida TaxID=116153 RepID=UPI0021481570|nr:OCIA domain-containing protein 1 [Aethina tumida]
MNTTNQSEPNVQDHRTFPGPNNRQYKFSPEELRVIKECNQESFYQRCLPLGGIFSATAYFGVKAGYFKAHPRFGPTPKVLVGVILGYFIGKFSYQRKCAEKLMQLPNSRVGEMLRLRRSGQINETIDGSFGAGMSLAPFPGIAQKDSYSDINPSSNLDIDTSRPYHEGLDDSQRPSLDNPIYEEELPPVISNQKTSYEELRRKNRDEYLQKRTGTYIEPARTPSQVHPPLSKASTSDAETSFKVKNKYGDEME